MADAHEELKRAAEQVREALEAVVIEEVEKRLPIREPSDEDFKTPKSALTWLGRLVLGIVVRSAISRALKRR